jgi:hypothetical protein
MRMLVRLEPMTSPPPPWLIDEIERERRVEMERVSLTIDGEDPRAKNEVPLGSEPGAPDEGTEQVPSRVIIIPI